MTRTTLSPEQCVRIVESMAEYLGHFLRASELFTILRNGMGPDSVDSLLAGREVQIGYLLEGVLEEGLLLEMTKPYLATMIEKDIGMKPAVTWP